jgi:hypothetical protein
LQAKCARKLIIFKKFAFLERFSITVDVITGAEKIPIPGMANGALNGPGIVLVFLEGSHWVISGMLSSENAVTRFRVP